ncbi:MAG: CatB-related O-acetyltransferase [Ruminococcus sp.]|jgi:virginiamycin A acetyltransferase|nr:CatB-related O-acetyltransferase [Ruminococcus sp.]
MIIYFQVPHKTNKYDQHYISKLTDSSATVAVTVGRDSYIVHMHLSTAEPFNFHVGRHCLIAHQTNVLLNVGHNWGAVATGELSALAENPIPQKGQLIIQNDVWIGFGATIMGGVKIGNGAVIAANSHVVKDVPPYAIVGGNPAKVIKYRFTEDQIKELQKIAWWDWDNEKIKACKADFSLPIAEFIEKHRVFTPPCFHTLKR